MSGAYPLLVNSQEIPVYCHMGINGCGDGGWTPVMKIDGKKVHLSLLICPSVTSFFLDNKREFFLCLIAEDLPLRFQLLE